MKLMPLLAVAAGFSLAAVFAQAQPADSEGQAAMSIATPGGGLGADAQAVFPANEVAAARRDFRAQCSKYETAATCECITAGFAQTLAPAEVRLAGAEMRVRAAQSESARAVAISARDRMAANLGMAGEAARTVALMRVEKLAAELAPVCAAPI